MFAEHKGNQSDKRVQLVDKSSTFLCGSAAYSTILTHKTPEEVVISTHHDAHPESTASCLLPRIWRGRARGGVSISGARHSKLWEDHLPRRCNLARSTISSLLFRSVLMAERNAILKPNKPNNVPDVESKDGVGNGAADKSRTHRFSHIIGNAMF